MGLPNQERQSRKFRKISSTNCCMGFSQVFGIYFDKTFAPVIQIESVRHLLAIVAFNGFDIMHVDCKTAFINGKSDLELYIQQPPGFIDKCFLHKVLHLNRSLYSLKWAPRIWYLLLCSVIIALGFKPLESDPCIYTNSNNTILIGIYVDDMLIMGSDPKVLNVIYNGLARHCKEWKEWKG